MYTRLIFAVQIVIFFFATQSTAAVFYALEGGRSENVLVTTFRVIPDEQLSDYVKKNVQQIEVAMTKFSNPTDRLRFIHDRVSRVAQFRSKNWSQSAFLEQQLDLEIKPFESFPQPQEFKKDRCSQYKSQISVEWEPLSADYRAVQSGVARALRVLKEICS